MQTKCPYKLLPEWVLLVDSLGENGAFGIFLANNEEVPTMEEVQIILNSTNVNYQLKSVDILQSSKADEIFRKGDKNNWNIDKILLELNIPKEQKELIKTFGTRNREEILSNLLANYSYTVVINTAKEGTNFYGAEDFIIGTTRYYTVTGEKFYKVENNFANNFNKESIEIDFKEFEKAAKQYKDINEEPTQHYSNLTVPGGTNYTENEIATPAVTPSIIGHAQFATDKGIGWFRSDDEAISPMKVRATEEQMKILASKGTRRILEVQSDLFQKGRDKSDLTNNKPDVILPIGTSGSGKSTFIKSLPQENLVVIEPDAMRVEFTGDMNDKSKDKEIYIEAANRAIKAIKQGKQVIFDTTNLTKDKRLPFIEAIKKEIPNANIQYKLMPLNPELAKQRIKADIAAGKNRANVSDSTIDRHAESYKQMLEDIKNEPISNYENTQTQFLQLLNKDSNWVTFFIKSIIQDSAKKGYEKVLFPTGNTASKVEGHTTLEEFKKQKEDRIKELEVDIKYTPETLKVGDTITQTNPFGGTAEVVIEDEKHLKSILSFYEPNIKEINQLKQELERVEKEGFAALRPIYNFYENTVTNILKKQGFNPVVITDEYNNTWNEIELNQNTLQKVQPVLFNNLKLDDKQEDHYINIGSSALDKLEYVSLLKKEVITETERKNKFILSFEAQNKKIIDLEKQKLNKVFIDEIKKENSILWDKIKKETALKYYIVEDEQEENFENLEELVKADWNDRILKSAEKTVSHKTKRLINTLKKDDTNTVSGFAESLNFKDIAGGLFQRFTSCRTNQEVLDKVNEISIYEPAFAELYTKLLNNKESLSLFARDIRRWFSENQIITVDNRQIKVITGNTKVFKQYQLGDEYSGVIFSKIKGLKYTEEIQTRAKAKKVLFSNYKDNENNQAVEALSSIFDELELEIDKKHLTNLFKLKEFKELQKSFNLLLEGLIGHHNNIFDQTKTFKPLMKDKEDIIELLNEPNIEQERQLTLIEALKDKEAEIAQVPFDSGGYLRQLGALIAQVDLYQPDAVYLNVNGNQRTNANYHSFASSFFAQKEDKEKFKQILVDFLQVPKMEYSNLLGLKNNKHSLLKSKDELNLENLNKLRFYEDGGIKNTVNREGVEYTDYDIKDYIIKSLYHFIDNGAYYVPTPSDSSTTALISFGKFITDNTDYKNIMLGNYAEVEKTDWFQAIWNTVLQEVSEMETAYNILFDEVNGRLVEKQNLPNLTKNYHYKSVDSNGKPILLDKSGNPTGKVFQFNNFGSNLGDLNSVVKGKVYTINQIKHSPIERQMKEETFRFVQNFVKDTINFVKNNVPDYEQIFKDTKKVGQIHPFLASFAINSFIWRVETNNLLGGNLADMSNNLDVFKRAKAAVSTKADFTYNSLNDGWHSFTISDNIRPLLLNINGVSKEIKSNNSDGISLITVREALERLKREGNYKEHDDYVQAIAEEKELTVPIFNQNKNLYYHNKFNPSTLRYEAKQVKNSELVLNKKAFQGTQLQELIDYVEELEKKLKTGIQINFESTVKQGTKKVFNLMDSDGNLSLTDEIKKEIEANLEYDNYAYLGKVQDTDVNIKNQVNQLGSQISKVIITNIDEDTVFKIGNQEFKGSEIREEFFNVLDTNIVESATELLERLKQDGVITEQSLAEVIRDVAEDLNWEENIVNALKDNEGKPLMPFYYSILEQKIQAVLTSLFTSNVIKQKHPGYHAYQAPAIFLNNIKRENVDKDERVKEQKEYDGQIDWLDSKKSDFTLAAPRVINNNVLEIEMLVGKWDKRFEGKSINEINEEALKSFGYRIPTEGKFSSFVFKVVGFLPESMKGTIIVPDGFTAITGSDFDIDSIYVMTYNLNANTSVVKYLTDKNSTIEERYEKYSINKEANRNQNIVNKFKKALKGDKFEKGEKEAYLDWFNKEYNTDIKSFYGIEAEILKQIYLINEKYIDYIIKLNDKSLPKKVLNKLETQFNELNEELNSLENTLSDFKEYLNEMSLSTEEKIVYKEKLQEYQDKLLQSSANKKDIADFAKLSISEQNTKAARQNRILDVFISIMSNVDTFEEATNPSEFSDISNAVDKVRSRELLNPNIWSHGVQLTTNILVNKTLKGIAVSNKNLADIGNVAKITSTIGLKVGISKADLEKYGLENIRQFYDYNEIENSITLNNIGFTKQGNKALNGLNVTDNTSKVVANIMDAVKYPFHANNNDYTLGVFMLFPAMGMFNYEYPVTFIEQGVITELIKTQGGKGFPNPNVNEFTKLKSEIYTLIKFIDSTFDNLATEEESILFERQLDIRDKNEKLIESKYDIYLSDEERLKLDTIGKETFGVNETVFTLPQLEKMLSFYRGNPDIFNLLKERSEIETDIAINIEKNKGDLSNVDFSERERFNEKIASINMSEARRFLTRQLIVLEQFRTYKKLADDYRDLAIMTSTDKRETGPELERNYDIIDKIGKAGLTKDGEINENYPFKIDGKNAIVAIYPKYFGLPQESAYKALESKFINGQLLAYDTLSPFFIQETDSIRDIINYFTRQSHKNLVKKEISRYLLTDLPFFQTTDKKTLLGIDTKFETNLDITTGDNLEAFTKLSAVNKLVLVKEQLYNSESLYNHVLNELYQDYDRKTRLYKISRRYLKNKNLYTKQFKEMLNSNNSYIKFLAYDLIKYTFVTQGWSYGNNIAPIVPVEILSDSEISNNLGLNIASHLREQYNKLKQSLVIADKEQLLDAFHRKNWENNELVPIAENKTIAVGEEYEYDRRYPVWQEEIEGFENTGLIYIRNLEYDKLRDTNPIKTKNYIKVRHGDTFKLYKKEAIEVEINKKSVIVGYLFKGLNKLQQDEYATESYLKSNNNSNYKKIAEQQFVERLTNKIENELNVDLKEENNSDLKQLKKQNIFTVTPIQSADKKAIVKASVANKYIGFGEGIANSSTELYRQQILNQHGKKIPTIGDIVTINFEIDYKDVEVKAKVLALEINLDENISNKGFSVDLENIKTGKKYGVYVDTDGTISQFEGKNGLRIGTDSYIKEFNIDSQKEANIVNSGNYNSNDVVFVSIGGKRGDIILRKEQQDKTIREALKAIEAGATLITDNKSYVESSDYNEGEKRLAKNLEAKGYNYSEQTVDGQVLGVWNKTKILYNNITYEKESDLTQEELLISTTKSVLKDVYHDIEASIHQVNSFASKKVIKRLHNKPIDEFEDDELESVYRKLIPFYIEMPDELRISMSGGIRNLIKTNREDAKELVSNLIIRYKDEVETTVEGIENKIFVPHKMIDVLNETEIEEQLRELYNYSNVRIGYFNALIKRFKDTQKDFNFNNLGQRNQYFKALLSIKLFSDTFAELENIKLVLDKSKQEELSPIQRKINYLVIEMNDLKSKLDDIQNEAKIISDKLLVKLIQETTTNDKLKSPEAIKEVINNMKDVSWYQMMLDSPVDTVNSLVANIIQNLTTLENKLKFESYDLKVEWEKLIGEKTFADYQEIFETDEVGDYNGQIKKLSSITTENRPIAEFLLNLKNVIKDVDTDSILNKRFFPAVPVLKKTTPAVILEKLGWFQNFDTGQTAYATRMGLKIKTTQYAYGSLVNQKNKVIIPEIQEGEEAGNYKIRALNQIFRVYSLHFESLEQVKHYNKQVDDYNKLLNGYKHGQNISYNLEEIMPKAIDLLYKYKFSKTVENEVMLYQRLMDDMSLTKNTGNKIVDKVEKRLTGKTKALTIQGKESNAKKQLDVWIDSNVFGNSNTSSPEATKWGRVLQQYTSIKGLGLNPFAGLNNISYGTIQNRISQVSDGDFNKKEFAKGSKKYMENKAISSYILDSDSKVKATTLQNALIKYFDIMNLQNETVEGNKNVINNKWDSFAQKSVNSLFLFNNIGEHMMQNKLLFAMLEGGKVIDGKIVHWKEYVKNKVQVGEATDSLDVIKEKAKQNKANLKDLREQFDNEKSLIDYFELTEGGYVHIKAGINDNELAKFKSYARKKGHKLHGIYNSEDISVAQRTVWGRWLFQFKKWMRPGWNKRYGSNFMKDAGYVESYREQDKGTYKSLYDFIRTPLIRRKANEGQLAFFAMGKILNDYKDFAWNVNLYYNTLSYEEQMKVKNASIEMLMFGLVILAAKASRGLSDDDELKENILFNLHLKNIDRLKTELGAYVPLSVVGSGGWLNESRKLMRTPTGTWSTMTDILKVVEDIAELPMGNDLYYKNGIYKGRVKVSKDFIDLIPIANQTQKWLYLRENNKAYKLY